ncbi:MAG: hypothetical protein FWH44_03595 [Methanomassiliicoccaceae archaeon]|nr:hypothetical protein [Methanomassiliicoccaceae archaeon]
MSQTYKVISSLSEKEFVRLDHGIVSIEKRTHIAILLEILNSSQDSYLALSDSGLEIIRTLTIPRTAAEISSVAGAHQTTVTRKIGIMRRMGMIRKEHSLYSANEALWPKLTELAHSYDEYAKRTDPRIPFGSEIFHSASDAVVFSSNRALNYERTAFSRYGEYGMEIHPGTNYYCISDDELNIKDIFIHSLYVVDKEKDWRNKMLALIFYVMHERELNDVSHPVVNDMRMVLNGGRVDGWVPLREMNERAMMYGVDLYDN